MRTIAACWWIFIIVFLCAKADAAVVQVPSGGTSADVQAAIDRAMSGDTVLLPAVCSSTWNTAISIPSTKGIKLDGNGCTVTRGAVTGALIVLTPNATTGSRITNFTWRANGLVIQVGSFGSPQGLVPYRLDHMTFNMNSGSQVIKVWSMPGVIDHNTFNWPVGGGEIIHNEAYQSGRTTGWTVDVIPGGWDALYLEDNAFIATGTGAFGGASAIQNYYGARTVFRYNTLQNCQFDAHGTAGMVGARWWEVYENDFITTAGVDQSDYIRLRGGSGVVFNNRHTGPSPRVDTLDLVEEDGGTYPELYQIGRGKNQTLDPAYVWGNGADFEIEATTSLIRPDRDYYLFAKPGYTPYTYPHPLTQDPVSSLPQRPASPTGVRIIR